MPARQRPPKPPSTPTVVQMRIQLQEVAPTVWRRLLVPGNAPLDRVHALFQAAMGWNNSHLHLFTIGDTDYGSDDIDDDVPEDQVDETTTTLLRALGSRRRFEYEYDFGDSWTHDVVIEATTPTRTALKFAVCLDGANACPPDDSHGAHGYAELLAARADPTHPDHADARQWLGDDFDPEEFDLAAANVALQAVR
jgi:hypothetical protein